MATFVRISALFCVDVLATFAMYVMMNYLTNVWNLSITHAAGIVNIWNGIIPILTIVFAFFVDAFMGDFYMLVFSSISYSIVSDSIVKGLGLLSMSTPAVFGPCHHYKVECVGHTQKVLFYTALPLIAVGMAGHVVSLPPFLKLHTRIINRTMTILQSRFRRGMGHTSIQNKEEKQEENENPNTNDCGGCIDKIHLQILGLIMVIAVPIVGGVVLPCIKPWSIRFGTPAICSVVATLLFFTVFWKCGTNPNDLYNDDNAHSNSCISVEDTKLILRLLPTWINFIVIGIVLSIGKTYFLEQANHMDSKLGITKIPIPIFLLFYNSTSPISAFVYTLWTICLPNKKHAPPVGIATGIVFSVLCCITAAKVETRRLHRIRDHGLLDKPEDMIPMSIFALLPQFMLLAAVDGIANTSIAALLRHQTPKSLHKYSSYFTKGVLGLGTMASVLFVYVVGKVSERNHNPNWFQYTLNKSHLDRYYWVLAALSAVNLVAYAIFAPFYKYEELPEDGDDEIQGGDIKEEFEEKN